jgi:hypothetical protein
LVSPQHDGAGSQTGAGAGSQQAGAGLQQSLLRLKIPAEALDDETMAMETTAKAIKTRRIRISPKLVKGQPPPRRNFGLMFPPGRADASEYTGGVDATKSLNNGSR